MFAERTTTMTNRQRFCFARAAYEKRGYRPYDVLYEKPLGGRDP